MSIQDLEAFGLELLGDMFWKAEVGVRLQVSDEKVHIIMFIQFIGSVDQLHRLAGYGGGMSRDVRLATNTLRDSVNLRKEQGGSKHRILKSSEPVDTGATAVDLRGILGDKLEVTGATNCIPIAGNARFRCGFVSTKSSGNYRNCPAIAQDLAWTCPVSIWNLRPRREQRGTCRAHWPFESSEGYIPGRGTAFLADLSRGTGS